LAHCPHPLRMWEVDDSKRDWSASACELRGAHGAPSRLCALEAYPKNCSTRTSPGTDGDKFRPIGPVTPGSLGRSGQPRGRGRARPRAMRSGVHPTARSRSSPQSSGARRSRCATALSSSTSMRAGPRHDQAEPRGAVRRGLPARQAHPLPLWQSVWLAFHRGATLPPISRGTGSAGKGTRMQAACLQEVPLPRCRCGAGSGRTIAWSHDDEFSSRDRSLTAKHTAEGRRARCCSGPTV
jgi:hypothetical protein